MPGTANSPPDRRALSGLVAGASFIAGVAASQALADDPFPRPGADPDTIRRYFTRNAGPARLSAAGQAISAVSLARFTASVARLAGRAGRGSRVLRAVALVGGGLAAASLATSAVTHAMLTDSKQDEDDSAKLARREFVVGGPLHGVGFGMLTGVLALAGLRTGELPRPVAITGLVSAASSLLSPLYFVWEPAGWLIPAGRFPGLVVSGTAGVQLARAAR